ncbi:unnamed protein product, partial [marine sediment metagenome]
IRREQTAGSGDLYIKRKTQARQGRTIEDNDAKDHKRLIE